MKLCLVYSKNRKKFDKYVKKNNISNKMVIDVKKMMEDEDISPGQMSDDFFKIHIWKKIEWALDRQKNIYYIPWTKNPNFNPNKTLKLRDLIPPEWIFELLLFHQDFKNDHKLSTVFTLIPEFDGSTIVEE